VVEDQNDNPPPAAFLLFFVTQVVAKDADEPNTLHTKIAYSLIKQEPNNGKLFFAVHKDNGTIFVNNPTLDREVSVTSYTDICTCVCLFVGSFKRNSATATVFIDILDVNDNIPTLEKDEFSASIDENEAPVEVMRIQALDNDEERTDNWLAEFKIVSGNEDGRFSIETDPKTNMGPVDFESASEMNLNLVVANKALLGAPLGGSVFKQKTYPVKINVKNKPEGPKFKPKIKPISVSENTKNSFPRVIDTYTAMEEDTGKTAEKVKYAKEYDPDNWISIDMDTAEIKLNKVPDRESPFLVNGTYYAKILCITDELHSQTSTGTIALQVEDLNDNCPKLLNNVQTVCSDTSIVNVTAEDEDSDPNGAPLEFSLIQEKTKGKWNLQRIDDVSVSMLAEDDLWPGFYEVTMEIRDKQGLACPDEQVLHLEVCTCSEGTFCASKLAALRTTSASLGAAGICFLILGFLCLILPLVACGTVREFTDVPFNAKESLIAYHTEGIGEDKTKNHCSRTERFPTMHPKMYPQCPFKQVSLMTAEHSARKLTKGLQKLTAKGFGTDETPFQQPTSAAVLSILRHSQFSFDSLLQKVSCLAANPPLTDGLLLYEYEGQGTPAGSVGRCSLLESDNDLEFLNNLGSKFLTLAELCHPPKPSLPPPKTEQVVKSVETSFKTESSVSTNTIQITTTIPPPQEVQQSSVTKVEMVNKSATLPSAKASQTLFVQQQPLFYLVEQQIPNTVFVESPTQGLYVINGKPGTEGLILQGGNVSQASLSRGQQAMYVINRAPVADIQPRQLQTAGQEQEAVMGCSPVSSPIGSPGGVLLMPMQFYKNTMQGVTGTPAILLADVPTLSKQKKKKTPSERLGTKGVDPKVKDTAASK
uniref:Cadherin domain-containing protein n=1 Tax=Sinocyclocheilus grahami TaxID=75366 RepID=A0A672KUL9_SINGR